MSWARVSLPVAEEDAEAGARRLFAEGAVAVEREGGALLAHFLEPEAARAAARRFPAQMVEAGAPGWAAEWLSGHAPIQVAARLCVAPTFVEAAAETVVRIDPGLAFGNGAHPTTFLCLQLLERLLRQGASVLDVGTGTGILAIAAARLGAGAVCATDIDPVALRTAERHARRNGVALRLREDLPGERYDLVLANLPPDALANLAPRIQASLAPEGSLVLSGFLASGARAAARPYRPLRIAERHERSGWAALVLRRHSSVTR